jgi:hypothetical protein
VLKLAGSITVVTAHNSFTFACRFEGIDNTVKITDTFLYPNALPFSVPEFHYLEVKIIPSFPSTKYLKQ